jgi:hypothetical protein
MGSHLVKINYYEIYKTYVPVMWTDLQWIDHTGSTHIYSRHSVPQNVSVYYKRKYNKFTPIVPTRSHQPK